MAALLSPASAAGAEWKAVERIETYAIAGKTGLALYESIGERGPLIRGKVRTVAYTDFKLTWTRDYQARDGVCTLASATPKLIITYRLPKPSAKLPADTARRWATFISGLEEHEKVHGDFIKEMVAGIEAQTVGLSVENDPLNVVSNVASPDALVLTVIVPAALAPSPWSSVSSCRE